MYKLFVLLSFISVNLFGQQQITFNLGSTAALNYNQPIYKLKNETLKPIQFNGSLALLGNLKLDFTEHAFVLEKIYHFRRYGSKLNVSNEFYDVNVTLKNFTETTTFNLKYQRFLKRIKLLNAKMHITTSIGYSIIMHTIESRNRYTEGKKTEVYVE